MLVVASRAKHIRPLTRPPLESEHPSRSWHTLDRLGVVETLSDLVVHQPAMDDSAIPRIDGRDLELRSTDVGFGFPLRGVLGSHVKFPSFIVSDNSFVLVALE